MPGVGAVHIGTLGPAELCLHSVTALTADKMDQACELLLDNANAALDNLVGLQRANALDLKVEAVRHGVVVEGLALLRRVFPLCVLALGPGVAG